MPSSIANVKDDFMLGYDARMTNKTGFAAMAAGGKNFLNIMNTESDFCWIVDPLDGTVNFLHRLPQFCVSVGLMHKGEMICGVIYAPFLQEFFVAEKGKGAYFNGEKIKTSKAKEIRKALGATGFPYNMQERHRRVFKNFEDIIMQAQAVRRPGSAALDIAYTACGRFDFFWEETMKAWDIAAGIVIAKEAGAIITDYKGGKEYFALNDDATIIVSANQILHKQVMDIINEK
jgi:myo-inositol-1(or 4)-monophosphatase